MATSPSPSPSVLDSLRKAISALFSLIGTVLRRVPLVAVFAVVVVLLYFRQPEQAEEPEPPTFSQSPAPRDHQPPADLPEGTNPFLWTCVSKVDSELSDGLWADIYYGMEARLDGKVVTMKVTEKWKDLSNDKRRTVATLFVDTWIQNGQELELLTSEKDLDEIVIKRLPDDQTVAAWTPTTGVQLFDPQVGA